jgi:hypothetical protein
MAGEYLGFDGAWGVPRKKFNHHAHFYQPHPLLTAEKLSSNRQSAQNTQQHFDVSTRDEVCW